MALDAEAFPKKQTRFERQEAHRRKVEGFMRGWRDGKGWAVVGQTSRKKDGKSGPGFPHWAMVEGGRHQPCR